MKLIIVFLLIVFFYITLRWSWVDESSEHITPLGIEAMEISVNTSAKELTTNTLVVSDISNKGNNIQLGDNLTMSKNLTIGGNICAGSVCLPQATFQNFINYWLLKDYMYNPAQARVYDNIFTAMTDNIIAKTGNPKGWDSTTYVQNLWNNKSILNIGTGASFANGLIVNVPLGYNVIWVRILNERWATIQVYGSEKLIGTYAGGYRNLNAYDPTGGTTDTYKNMHVWMPMAIPNGGTTYVLSGMGGTYGNDCFISGIAFSTNPWNHVVTSAVTYFWALNGGKPIDWYGENWQNDQLGQLTSGKTVTMAVPVITNGNDKLFYIVEHNDAWGSGLHYSVTANGIVIERLRTTYINPFATHHNSKPYSRYLAAKIPSKVISAGVTPNIVNIQIDMTHANDNIYIREAGTHDYY